MHMRLCCLAARAELRNDHRQSTAAGTGICANQVTRDMGRDCFRNRRLSKREIAYLILKSFGG